MVLTKLIGEAKLSITKTTEEKTKLGKDEVATGS